jgi:hypothetical protein
MDELDVGICEIDQKYKSLGSLLRLQHTKTGKEKEIITKYSLFLSDEIMEMSKIKTCFPCGCYTCEKHTRNL